MDTIFWNDVIARAKNGPLSIPEISNLTTQLGESGLVIDFLNKNTADIASTGGPSSLSTLITPLLLQNSGYTIPKLGVPGRPAGGIDVLAQIENFRVNFNADEIQEKVFPSGYLHFLSGGLIAPLDAEVFRLRQERQAQAIPDLVIASILSKKVALGIKTVGLDVRVAKHGNFGKNFTEARINSEKFIEVARYLGIKAVCILTDASNPYQPYIGRGESLLALSNLFSNNADKWLNNHYRQCSNMVQALTGIQTQVSLQAVKTSFLDNIKLQSGKIDSFNTTAKEIEISHLHKITSPNSGYVKYDLGRIRSAILKCRKASSLDTPYPDECGVQLLANTNILVQAGEEVMSIRCSPEKEYKFVDQLKTSIKIQKIPEKRYKDEVVL